MGIDCRCPLGWQNGNPKKESKMIGLDRLMQRPGVVAVGQFTEDGKFKRAVGELSEQMKETVAKICASLEKNASDATTALTGATGMKWNGLNGWVIWGGEYALCVSGNTGVFVETTRADFNQLIADLFGPPAAGRQVTM